MKKFIVLVLAFLLIGCGGSGGGKHPSGVPGGETYLDSVFFDDFTYQSNSDPNLSGFQWSIRYNPIFLPDNISFINDSERTNNRLLRLTATVDGSTNPVTIRQAEIYQPERFREGTYAARVRFYDTPIEGTDGDQICSTFFTIYDERFDDDPNYSECDFEYLANGGWNEPTSAMFFTTWEKRNETAGTREKITDIVRRSFNGWHVLTLVVLNGTVRYYIDGQLLATHGGEYYPESNMRIDFNLWFITAGLLAGDSSTRRYVQDVDWVYIAQNRELTTDQVLSQVGNLRQRGYPRLDSVE